MARMHVREKELNGRRKQEMRKIQKDSNQFLRKYANSKNMMAELAKERQKEENGGSDSDHDKDEQQRFEAAKNDPADEDY